MSADAGAVSSVTETMTDASPQPIRPGQPLLQVSDLVKHFPIRGGGS